MANRNNSWIRSWLPKTSPHYELQNQFISNYTPPSAQSFPRIHGGWPWLTQLADVFCEKNSEDHPGNHHGAQSQLRFGTPAFRSGIGTACSPAHQGNLPGESSGVAPGRAWGLWKKMQKGHLQVRYELCWMDPNHESSCSFKVTVQQLQHAKKYSDLGHHRCPMARLQGKSSVCVIEASVAKAAIRCGSCCFGASNHWFLRNTPTAAFTCVHLVSWCNKHHQEKWYGYSNSCHFLRALVKSLVSL